MILGNFEIKFKYEGNEYIVSHFEGISKIKSGEQEAEYLDSHFNALITKHYKEGEPKDSRTFERIIDSIFKSDIALLED